MKTIYTFGYQSSRSMRIVADLQHIQYPFSFVDVRYNPDGGRWEWRREYFSKQPGIDYHWIQNLGNEKYQESMRSKEPVIQIANMAAGLEELVLILNDHDRAAIFCACSNGNRCHRRTVAQAAKERLGVQVVHL